MAPTVLAAGLGTSCPRPSSRGPRRRELHAPGASPRRTCDVTPRGDGGERPDRRPRPVGREGRGGSAAMVARDAAAQGGPPDPEPQRRIEDERLAVDAGGHGAVRVDLERRRRPRSRAGVVCPASRARRCRGRRRRGAVACRARSRTGPVAVVRDDDGYAALVLVPVGPAPAEVRLPSGPQDVRHGVEQRPELRAAVARALDRLAVNARARRC